MSLRNLLAAVVLAGIAVALLGKSRDRAWESFVRDLEASSNEDQFDDTGAFSP